MSTELAVFLGLVAVYGAVAAWLGRFSVTMPIIFVVVGVLIGPRGLFTVGGAETATEMTLAILLFADASTLDYRHVRDDARLPARLLMIGMPLIVLLGSITAYGLFPGEGLGFALLMGAILAPTDAALGLPIFGNRRVPVRIRRALNVESGFNDGIATPLVALFLALTLAGGHYESGRWFSSALTEIGIGAGVGFAAGLFGGWLIVTAVKRGWTSTTGQQISTLALALCTFSAATALGGNGFIAAFLGGLLFGYASSERLQMATEFTETSGTLMSLFVWTVFGANLAAPLLSSIDARALLYALLSLTVIRLLPVAISLIGAHLRADTVLMMGWLGPRGLASVVFTLVAFEAFHEAGRPLDSLTAMAGWTILLSVVLHGFSAMPLANWYARRLETADPEVPELHEQAELRTNNGRTASPLHHS